MFPRYVSENKVQNLYMKNLKYIFIHIPGACNVSYRGWLQRGKLFDSLSNPKYVEKCTKLLRYNLIGISSNIVERFKKRKKSSDYRL